MSGVPFAMVPFVEAIFALLSSRGRGRMRGDRTEPKSGERGDEVKVFRRQRALTFALLPSAFNASLTSGCVRYAFLWDGTTQASPSCRKNDGQSWQEQPVERVIQ